jgi:ATP-dependent helicase/nuclease subunit A
MSLIVEAAAGTGKTESLVTHLLRRLFGDPPVRLSRILALTFTEKAANEMRKRVTDLLAELVRGDPETAKKVRDRIGRNVDNAALRSGAREAIAEIESAQIATIHSFCAHILRLYPIEAGVVPGFEVDEGEQFELLFERRWREWLDAQLSGAGAFREEWEDLLGAASLEELRELAAELCRRQAVPLPVESRAPSREAVEAMLARAVGLQERLPPGNNDNARSLKLSAELMRAFLGGRLKGSDAGRAKHIVDGPPDQKKYQQVREEMAAVCAFGRALPGALAASRAGRLLSPFARDFRDEFLRLGHLTFDGLVSFARRLLRDNLYVRYRLKTLFEAILVDEFQDTDPLQYDLILLLAERPEKSGGEPRQVELQPGKLYIVGDPKQSIYAFRGADLQAYEATKQAILRNGGREECLDINYRSRPEILRVVNAVFGKLMRFQEGLQPRYIEFQARPSSGPQVEDAVEFVRVVGGAGAEEAREAEAAFIADWIEESIPEGGRGRVALLLRSLNDVQVYLDRLRRKAIPYVIEGEKFYYQAQEIIDAKNLLAAAVNPHDAIAVVGFLRSFAAGLDDAEVVALRGRFDYRSVLPENPHARKVYAALKDLHDRSGRLRVDELVDLALERFPLLMAASATYYGPQAVSNLLKLRLQAGEAAASGRTSVADFVDRLRRSVESFREEGESPIADERLDAVKVLSIHKAKGLEFDTVILPDLHRQLPDAIDTKVLFDWTSGRTGLLLGRDRADAAAMELAARLAERKRQEARRVLYVAMTRARSKLILTGAFVNRPSSSALLIEAIPALAERPAGRIQIGGASVRIRDIRYGGPGRLRRRVRRDALRADPEGLARGWERRKALEEKIRSTPLFWSPSDLSEKKVDVGEEEEPAPPRLERAAWVGIVCHDALARIDLSRPRAEVGPSLRAVPRGMREAVGREARRLLARFFASAGFRRIRGAKLLGREIPFTLRREGRIYAGRLDALLEEQGVLWVLDYKSFAGDLFDRHAPQLEVYRDAVERATGRPVRAAVVSLADGAWVENTPEFLQRKSVRQE